jgi:hypothetical protein
MTLITLIEGTRPVMMDSKRDLLGGVVTQLNLQQGMHTYTAWELVYVLYVSCNLMFEDYWYPFLLLLLLVLV